MTNLERYDDILCLGQRFLYERKNNLVFNRENSETYSWEKGRFEGYLMANKMTYEIVGNAILVFKNGKMLYEIR